MVPGYYISLLVRNLLVCKSYEFPYVTAQVPRDSVSLEFKVSIASLKASNRTGSEGDEGQSWESFLQCVSLGDIISRIYSSPIGYLINPISIKVLFTFISLMRNRITMISMMSIIVGYNSNNRRLIHNSSPVISLWSQNFWLLSTSIIA